MLFSEQKGTAAQPGLLRQAGAEAAGELALYVPALPPVSPAWHRPALSHVDFPSVKLWENSDQVINFIRVGRQE